MACLLLALFSALGYFHIEALFIDFFCGLVKGLIGYGFWLVPPALLLTSYILAFHRGRPVCLPVVCALLMPLMMACTVHGLTVQVLPGRSPAQDVVGERPGHDQRRRGRRSAGPGAGPGGERLGIHRGLCAGLPAHGPGGVPPHHSGCGRLDLQPAPV